MVMEPNLPDEPLRFMLTDKSPGSDAKYLIQCPNEEVKNNWVSSLKSILDMQGFFTIGKRFIVVMCNSSSCFKCDHSKDSISCLFRNCSCVLIFNINLIIFLAITNPTKMRSTDL